MVVAVFYSCIIWIHSFFLLFQKKIFPLCAIELDWQEQSNDYSTQRFTSLSDIAWCSKKWSDALDVAAYYSEISCDSWTELDWCGKAQSAIISTGEYIHAGPTSETAYGMKLPLCLCFHRYIFRWFTCSVVIISLDSINGTHIWSSWCVSTHKRYLFTMLDSLVRTYALVYA